MKKEILSLDEIKKFLALPENLDKIFDLRNGDY